LLTIKFVKQFRFSTRQNKDKSSDSIVCTAAAAFICNVLLAKPF